MCKNLRRKIMMVASAICVGGAPVVATDTILERYESAQSVLRGANGEMTINTTVNPTWIGDNHFWYVRTQKGQRSEYRIVNAEKASNEAAFDHNTLAKVLAKATGENVIADQLPLTAVEVSLSPLTVGFMAFDKKWSYFAKSETLKEIPMIDPMWVVSPDGKTAAFEKGADIWLHDMASGREWALTTDGTEYNVYGARGLAWGIMPAHDQPVQVRWSPDSQRIFTLQRDTRKVKELPMVHHVPADGSTRPTLETFKIAYPGDEHVETMRLVSIDVKTGKQQPANYEKIPTSRNGYGFFYAGWGWWGKDSRHAYFVHVDRHYKYARLVEFDTTTGKTRQILEETSDTHVRLMQNGDMFPNYYPLPETNEILWYSDRTGWAHYYLYDLKTGKLKNTVTSGDWLVRDTVHVDPKRREVFLQTGGRKRDQSPYYRDLVRVNIDTGKMTSISSGNFDHFASAPSDMQTASTGVSGGISISGDYAVVTRSRVDTVPVSMLLDRNGKKVMTLEKADVSGLPKGWQWPEPVKLVADDGKTDIYGVVYRPSYFTPNKKWPVIAHTFSTPDFPWTSTGSFTNGIAGGWPFYDAVALAELGFIVVQIDGRGSSFRSKAFLDASYGWVENASMLQDQAAGIKQLGERYDYIDLDRVGITTHPSGSPGGIHGLLMFPDFFKVGVQGVIHDNRLMPDVMWGGMYENEPAPEKWNPEDKIANLKGKLLITQGMLDNCCSPPAAAFRVVGALQKANKDFDMVFLPKVGHGSNSYLIRRSWDFLVKHLQGVEPPKEFKLTGTMYN